MPRSVCGASCVVVTSVCAVARCFPGADELNSELDASISIQDEDVWISERVQRGLMSASYDTGRYAPAVEGAEHHFHKLLSSTIGAYLRDADATSTL